MKIEKNSQNPCASGKKYKNCCMNKSSVKKTVIQSPYDNDFTILNADKILNLFSEYDFFDLCRAIFAINSFAQNRAHYQFSMGLNWCLSQLKNTGNKKIYNYEDFVDFFHKIESFFVKTPLDDNICPDFGEVKINIEGQFYKVLIGTGFNNSFAFYILCEELVPFLTEKENILIGLKFINQMISSLESHNTLNKKYNFKELYLPNYEYFEAVKNYYKLEKFDTDIKLWQTVFKSDFIETEHFLFRDSHAYLLFNTSFIIDLVSFFIKQMKDEDLEAFIDLSLINIINKNFDLDPEGKNVLAPVVVTFGLTQKPYLMATALARNNNAIILFMPKNKKFPKNYKDEINKNIKKGNIYAFRTENSGYMKGLKLENSSIQFILYDYHVDLTESGFLLIGKDNMDDVTILDLIHIITRCKDISELNNFFTYIKSTNTRFRNVFDGLAGFYELWKSSDQLIEKGAVKFRSVFSDIYDGDFNVLETYRFYNQAFPFTPATPLFSNPNSWSMKEIQKNYYSCVNEAVKGFGGYLYNIYNIHIFFGHNISHFHDLKELKYSQMFDEILYQLFNKYKNLISKYVSESYVYEFIIIPFSCQSMFNLHKVADGLMGTNVIHENIFQIILAVDFEKTIRLLIGNQNRENEINLFCNVLSLFNMANLEILYNTLKLDCGKPKICLLNEYQCPYFKDTINLIKWPTNLMTAQVRKEIAMLCKDLNIKCGKYKGKAGLDRIRKIQTPLQNKIESELANFSKIDLHITLMSILAQLYHIKRETNIQYNLCKNAHKNREAKQHIIQREEAKSRIRVVQYLIESNLSLNIKMSTKTIDEDDLLKLLAYGEWFVNLQDTGDKLKWDFADAILIIDFDYKISSLYTGKYIKIGSETQKRTYANKDYMPQRDIDNEIEVLTTALTKDLGFSFKALTSLLNYLKLEFNYTFKNSIAPDVFVIDKNNLLKDVEDILINKEEIIEIKKALDYLTISHKDIKTIIKNGQEVTQPLIPLWERENRIERIDIKPLVTNDNNLIFSPVLINDLFDRWCSAIESYFPPYEIGLTNYKKAIIKLQRSCQKEMEYSILELCKSFKGSNDFADRSIKLHKRFPGQGFPENLGDYDCLFIDTQRKIIWNLESKFLQYVGSISEFSKHQQTFYNQDKKDEKFKMRIKYLEGNYQKLLNCLSIPIEQYCIKSYMITNKVFISMFKKIDIKIITYDEFKSLITKAYKDHKQKK